MPFRHPQQSTCPWLSRPTLPPPAHPLAPLSLLQSGTRSSFYLTSVNVGAIQAITLRTEDAAAAAASPSQWGVSLVEVTNNSSGSKAVCEWSKGYVQAGVAVRIDRTKHEADFEVREACVGG